MDPLPERPRGRFSPVVRAAEAAFWAAQAPAARAWTQAFAETRGPRADPGRPLVALLLDGPTDGSSGGGAVSPASRFRALQLVPHLERAGLEVRLLPSDPPKFLRASGAPWPVGAAQAAVDLLRQERARYEDLLRCADADVVLAMRDLQDAAWSRLDGLLHLAHDRLVLDVDDAIWTTHDQDAAEARLQLRKWRGLVRGASTVVASTPVVAERARQDGAARVALLPTAVDLERYRPASAPAPRDRPVVGWLGTSGNLGYLRRIVPALERVAATAPFELRVMCDPVEGWPALAGAPSRLVPWTPGGDVGFLQGLDVGLMPLDDTEWCRGKAAFKLVQYMACGVAVVASPVGFNVDVVGTDGARGLLAADEDAWVEALGRLLRDPGLRGRLGAAGRAHVAASFGAAEVGARLAATLRAAATAPGFGGLREARAATRVLRWAPALDADDGPRARAAALAASGDVEVVLAGPLVADLPPRERLEGGLVVVRLGAPAAPYLRPDPIGRAAGAFVRRHARAFDRLELDGDGPGARAAAEAARAAGLAVAR